jgi:PAS domain S-box-containing protein
VVCRYGTNFTLQNCDGAGVCGHVTTRPLRILSVEDDPNDAQLIQEVLEGDGIVCEMTRVEARDAVVEALKRGGIDLILADYSLPGFDGIAALRLALEMRPEVPFLFVSGTLGEDVAIEALKIGATDYVLKQKLSRLAPSVLRALREARERAERKQADEKLRRSEAYLAQAQTLSSTGSFGWDVATGKIYWSEETFRIFGFDPKEVATTEMVIERTHPEDREATAEIIQRVTQEKQEWDFEHRLLMPDGTIKHLRVKAYPSKDDQGNFEFVGAVSDVTERKRAEQVLRRTENYLAEAQRLTHTGSFVWRVSDGNSVFLSDEWYRIYGFDPKDGMPVWQRRLDRIHPGDRERWQEVIGQAIRHKTDYDLEFRLLLPDGTIKWVHTVGHPLLNNAGELVEFLGTTTDISERKVSEHALRRSEGYLEEAQRMTGSGSWAWDVRSGDLFWSQEMSRIFGYEPAKTRATTEQFWGRVHPEDLASVRERAARERSVKEMIDSGGDFRIVLPNGEIRRIHSIAHPVLNEQGEIIEVVGTAVDVTEQHAAQMALQTAFEQIKTLKDQLHNENIALREEIDRSSMFEEIVGESPALQSVLALIVKVAPTDSTVLITGETGTGKELVARAIHKQSQRENRAFISVNCAAIPHSLISSELFGHEKGAFTGATQRRLGRFELAEGGTIFLDEIGELPLDTQMTLLRVLQEREFERVGGSRVIRANVRVIAATNRDLQQSVSLGTFRSDLYYRLHVFPIPLPPLRKRKEDIPLLVEYFINRYATKAGKKIHGINATALERLKSYNWPGNIRELQNVIERSVIVGENENFTVDESWLSHRGTESSQTGPLSKMPASQERETIEAALADSQGRVAGPAGAAAKLGIPPSTLDSKIKAFGIKKNRFKIA